MKFFNDYTVFLEEISNYRNLTDIDLDYKNMSNILNLEKETEARVKRIEQQIQHDKEEHDLKMKILQTELRVLTLKFRKTRAILKKENSNSSNTSIQRKRRDQTDSSPKIMVH